MPWALIVAAGGAGGATRQALPPRPSWPAPATRPCPRPARPQGGHLPWLFWVCGKQRTGLREGRRHRAKGRGPGQAWRGPGRDAWVCPSRYFDPTLKWTESSGGISPALFQALAAQHGQPAALWAGLSGNPGPSDPVPGPLALLCPVSSSLIIQVSTHLEASSVKAKIGQTHPCPEGCKTASWRKRQFRPACQDGLHLG